MPSKIPGQLFTQPTKPKEPKPSRPTRGDIIPNPQKETEKTMARQKHDTGVKKRRKREQTQTQQNTTTRSDREQQ